MGYEVEENVITSLVDHMLSMPRDPKEEGYEAYEEKSSVVHMEHKSKEIKRNMEKMKAQVVEMMGFPKGIVEEAKNISNTLWCRAPSEVMPPIGNLVNFESSSSYACKQGHI